MPAASRPARRRRWHQKTFSGCLRCKQRHVKCGEEKPACQKCINLGVSCPGYKLPLTRLFELKPSKHFDCKEDELNYDFFVRDGVETVASAQSTSLRFWTRLAPQLAENDAGIRHGLIALGAILRPLHNAPIERRLDRPRQALQMPPSAARHARQALNCMKVLDCGVLPVEVSLTYCILSRELAIWTEKEPSPVDHLLIAHGILQSKSVHNLGVSWMAHNDLLATFVPLVDQLLVHACSYSDDFPPVDSGLLSNYQLVNGLERIQTVSTWADALDSIASLLKSVFRVTCPFIVSTDAELGYILCSLNMFEEKLQKIRAESGLAGDYLHLQVHHRVAHIMFHTLGQDDEWKYDKFQPDFYFIVEQMKMMLASRCWGYSKWNDDDTVGHHAARLSPTLGWIAPLWFVATKCRDSYLRQQALRLLHDLRRAERGWTSCMAAAIARFVIEEEQKPVSPVSDADMSGSSAIYHLERRVELNEVEFCSKERKVFLAYTVSGKYDTVAEKCIDSIPYTPHPTVEKDNGETCPMSRKVLRHCGYSGILLYSPHIDCHCADLAG
ncbi:hypothetical protein PV05_00498 [Exophiala xenobiotica]|uniref:Zn(2)-C6 fungal-type domain-containing protein n=1 Tax=Exophiala xenobiotica TaxID=348802 RepID=A0A0D2EWZ9_9EURO|nr:uncharacterized protein PV05_00498 [Exophiala xenobiotica]KIW60268.1 hypothetical protein PV05_00498 [Exophiala xenobiotica]